MAITINPISVPVPSTSGLTCNSLWINEMHVNAQNPSLGDTPSASMNLLPYYQPSGSSPIFSTNDNIIYWSTQNLLIAATNLATNGYPSLLTAIEAIYLCTTDLLAYKADRLNDINIAQSGVFSNQAMLVSGQLTINKDQVNLTGYQTILANLVQSSGVLSDIQTAEQNVNIAQSGLLSDQTALITYQNNIEFYQNGVKVANAAWQDPANPVWIQP